MPREARALGACPFLKESISDGVAAPWGWAGLAGGGCVLGCWGASREISGWLPGHGFCWRRRPGVVKGEGERIWGEPDLWK
jgi:hypothetical protein